MRLSSKLVPIAMAINHVCGIRIATWNLRYDSKPDSISVPESIAAIRPPLQEPAYLNIANGTEQPWSNRRIRVAQYLLAKGILILGVQEALVRQVEDLAELFGDEWSWVGVGRDDGDASGEFSAIFWNTNQVTLVSNDTFWLSDTPSVPSKYPGAGSIRLVTATKFRVIAGGATLSVLNTHFDDQSNDQRMLGASMLLARAKYEAYNGGTGDGKVFVIGDFNSPPTGTDSEGYKIATGQLAPVSINATWAEKYAVPDGELGDFKMLDLRGEAPPQSVSGNYATYTGFSAPTNTRAWTRIDFVFGGGNGGWEAQSYIVDSSLNDDGMLMSDHRPTVVDVGL